jgi:hypothetical protein
MYQIDHARNIDVRLRTIRDDRRLYKSESGSESEKKKSKSKQAEKEKGRGGLYNTRTIILRAILLVIAVITMMAKKAKAKKNKDFVL